MSALRPSSTSYDGAWYLVPPLSQLKKILVWWNKCEINKVHQPIYLAMDHNTQRVSVAAGTGSCLTSAESGAQCICVPDVLKRGGNFVTLYPSIVGFDVVESAGACLQLTKMLNRKHHVFWTLEEIRECENRSPHRHRTFLKWDDSTHLNICTHTLLQI